MIQDNKKCELVKDICAKVMKESDMDWAEIAALYDLDMSSETLRKAGVGIKLAAEAGMLNINGDDSLNEYDKSYKLKRQFFDQRREYNKLLTYDARREHLENVIRECAREVASVRPLMCSSLSPIVGLTNNSSEGILILSDWHYGLITDNVWNKFDTSICRKRIEYLINKTIEKILQNNIGTMNIIVLGDMAAGAIHTSCRVASEELTCDQLIHASELIASVIDCISLHIPKISVYCTYGNHMRMVQNLSESIHYDNAERIIPWWLTERFSQCDNVDIYDCDQDGFIRFNVLGYNILATHGDLDVDKNAAIRLNSLFEKVHGSGIDYLITAHMHHYEECESIGIDRIQVGSLCGTDEYAKNKRLYSIPSQTLLIFNNEDGLEYKCDIKFNRKSDPHVI